MINRAQPLFAFLIVTFILFTLAYPGITQDETFWSAEQADAYAETAPHTARFGELGFNRPLSFILYDVTNEALLASVWQDHQLPVASAVKGPILLYFFAHVPSDIWATVPVEYWNAAASDVPDRYQDALREHQSILRALYRMIVYSDNFATGDALYYAYTHDTAHADANPIVAFNRWSEAVIGTSPQSGMREWDKGATGRTGYIDRRFEQRLTTIRGVPRFYNNTYSARDVARFYHWLATEAPPLMYERARDVMSIIEGFPGFLETAALSVGGTPISKDGFVGPGDEYNNRVEYLTADAGLIELPERTLIVVSMAVNGGDKLEGIYNEVARIIRADRAEVFWPGNMDAYTWLRSDLGPYGANDLNGEAINFILHYLNEREPRLQPGQTFTGDRQRFEQARELWFAIFPDGRIPAERSAMQSRVIAIRYGNSRETLHDLARELGLHQD